MDPCNKGCIFGRPGLSSSVSGHCKSTCKESENNLVDY